jgi:hypothetical protein
VSVPYSLDKTTRDDLCARLLGVLRQTDMVQDRIPVVDKLVDAAEIAIRQILHDELQHLADDTIAEESANEIWYALSRRARAIVGIDDEAGE